MFKNTGIPHVGQHCIVHEGVQVKRVMTIRERDLDYISQVHNFQKLKKYIT